MRTTTASARALAAALALALVVAACGDDDDDAGDSSTTQAGVTTTIADTEPDDDTTTTVADTEPDDEDDGPTTTKAGSSTTAAAPSTTAAATTTTVAEDPMDPDAELRFAYSFIHRSLDPHLDPSAAGDAAWMRPVYDGLTALQATADGIQVVPQLAESWEIAEDGLSIEFVLRDGVTFQDGTPFDGEVVRLNVERAKSPESAVSSGLSMVDSVEVVDDTHVTYHLNRPYPGLLYSLAVGSLGMMVSPAAFGTDLATTPVGTGPFELVSNTEGTVVYERWDGHWDPNVARVAKVTIYSVSDINARYNALQAGQYDAAYLAPPIDLQSKALEAQGYQWIQALAPIARGVLLNPSMEPFDDVRVRKAVWMAIDRATISESLLGGLSPAMNEVFGPGYLGHDPALDTDQYDPDAARALIQEAGAEGAQVTLLTSQNAPFSTIAQVVQQSLNDIGLQVEIEIVDAAVVTSTWREGGFAAVVNTILGDPEPSLTLAKSYLGGDNPGDPDPELVALSDAALKLPLDSDEREAAYQEIAAYLTENPIHVPIVQFSTVVLARSNVVNAASMVPVAIGNLDFRGVGIAPG